MKRHTHFKSTLAIALLLCAFGAESGEARKQAPQLPAPPVSNAQSNSAQGD